VQAEGKIGKIGRNSGWDKGRQSKFIASFPPQKCTILSLKVFTKCTHTPCKTITKTLNFRHLKNQDVPFCDIFETFREHPQLMLFKRAPHDQQKREKSLLKAVKRNKLWTTRKKNAAPFSLLKIKMNTLNFR